MSYVDGFLAAVPLANKDAYIAHAKKMEPLLREFGVDDVTEGVGRTGVQASREHARPEPGVEVVHVGPEFAQRARWPVREAP